MVHNADEIAGVVDESVIIYPVIPFVSVAVSVILLIVREFTGVGTVKVVMTGAVASMLIDRPVNADETFQAASLTQA